MIIQEEVERLVGLGLTPILIKGSGTYDYEEEHDQVVYDSSFIDFEELLRRLNINFVQVEVFHFGQVDLIAEFNDRDDANSGSDQSFEKNLTSYDPSLNELKQYWGKPCCIRLLTQTPMGNLRHDLKPTWFSQYIETRKMLIERCEHEYDDAANEIEADDAVRYEEEQKHHEQLIAGMWQLLTDEEFCRVPTQKAQIDYAISKIPDLNEVDYDTLKAEMQKIKSRILARGLNKGKKLSDPVDVMPPTQVTLAKPRKTNKTQRSAELHTGLNWPLPSK